ncbi:MAG: MarR family winged helix-turn-helix transcriptional regulator [Emergencia sp.]
MNRHHIGYMIKSINDKLKVRADEDLKRYNLTLQQNRILGYLRERGGSASQKEIESFLEVSHPTASGLVSRMEQKGFLECRTDPADKRNKIVFLTPLAEETAGRIESQIDENEKKLLQSLSEEEITALENALQIIYDNISRQR